MKREIKFRAWDMILKKMLTMKEIQQAGMNLFTLCEGNKHVKLMQYTGLKDCNGKEIYEGDRWRGYGGRIFVVEYSEGNAGFLPFVMDDSCGCCSEETRRNAEDGEVIGNIYDNPDLLEG